MIGRRSHRPARTVFAALFTAVGICALAPAVASAQWQTEQPAPPPPGQPQIAQPVPSQPVQPVQPASPYDPTMQAGGLSPPPPMSSSSRTPSSAGSTEMRLDEAKDKDSGRGLSFFYVSTEGGFEHVELQTFNVDEENFTAGFIESTADGGIVGAGVGLQLLFLTVGARGRVGFFDAWQLFSVGGEVGFHIPIGRFEPHLDLGVGYAALGSVQGAIEGAADAISIHGVYARAGGGLDIFVTPVLSIGANVSWEYLGLTRPGISLDQIEAIKNDPDTTDVQRAKAEVLQFEGSGYGSAIAVTGVLGLHF